MAYAAIPTKAPGDLLTSALWNTYLQGNADSGFMRMIADLTVGASPVANVDFASLPQTFAHLFVILQARGDTAATSTTLNVQFGGDTGSNYDSGAGISGTVQTGATSGSCGAMSAGSATANCFSPYLLWIPHYAQTDTFKVCQTLGFVATSGGVNLSPYSQQILWKKSAPAAVDRIKFIPGAGNFVQFSRFTIYGIPA